MQPRSTRSSISGSGPDAGAWNHPLLVLAAVIALVTVPVTAVASGNSLVVTPTGTDNGACTPADPCRSISHAEDVATAGDTIYVTPGTYDETVTVGTTSVTICGTELAALAEDDLSCGGLATAVTVDATGESSANVFTIGTNDVTLQGLNIVAGLSQNGVRVAGANAEVLDNSITTDYANEDAGPRLIGVDVVADSVTIEGNEFTGWVANAVALWRADGTVAHNTFDNNRVGVHLSDAADDTTIEWNTFADNGWAIKFANGNDGQSSKNVDVNDNLLGPSNAVPLLIEEGNSGAGLQVDAQENWWGVVGCDAIDLRIQNNADDATVDVTPYRLTPLDEVQSDDLALADPTCEDTSSASVDPGTVGVLP